MHTSGLGKRRTRSRARAADPRMVAGAGVVVVLLPVSLSKRGVFRRAYWINPGYEWTPTQTGGTPIFSVSQKLYLFALITLDEGLTDPDASGKTVGYSTPVLPGARRRMLLQSTPSSDEELQDGQSEVGGGVFEFQTSPAQMMAKAFDVPQDRVSTFKAKLQLTQTEACMPTTELQGSLRGTLDDYLSRTAGPYHTVQLVSMSVDKAGVQCSRRWARALPSSFSAATAEMTMLVVFKEGQDSVISLAKLQRMAGVVSVEPLSVPAQVIISDDVAFDPPRDASFGKDASEGGSSSNAAIIVGAAAGGAAAIAVIAGLMLFMRRKSEKEDMLQAVTTINVESLKQQLQEEV